MKMEWEGGLEQFIDYGIPCRLYLLFQKEFDEIYEQIERKEKRNSKKNKMILDMLIGNLKRKITDYLEVNEEFTDNELNDVDYIFDETKESISKKFN